MDGIWRIMEWKKRRRKWSAEIEAKAKDGDKSLLAIPEHNTTLSGVRKQIPFIAFYILIPIDSPI